MIKIHIKNILGWVWHPLWLVEHIWAFSSTDRLKWNQQLLLFCRRYDSSAIDIRNWQSSKTSDLRSATERNDGSYDLEWSGKRTTFMGDVSGRDEHGLDTGYEGTVSRLFDFAWDFLPYEIYPDCVVSCTSLRIRGKAHNAYKLQVVIFYIIIII